MVVHVFDPLASRKNKSVRESGETDTFYREQILEEASPGGVTFSWVYSET